MIELLAIVAFLTACPVLRAYIDPWRPCKCAGRKCVRCRWTGKRPRLLARVVRRPKLREEGWLR